LKEQNMNRKLILSLMLAAGFAFAQSGSSDTQSSQPGSSQTTPSAQQPSTPSQPTEQSPGTPSTATSSANGQDTVVRGCLKQSGGDWVLSEAGQNITIKGDDSMLKPHNGHQVELHGARGSDPSTLQVTSVNMISDSCTTGQASATGMPDTTSAASAGAASSSTPLGSTSGPSSAATPDQTQTPSATQTPSTSSASSDQTATSPSSTAGQNAGNTSSASAAGNTPDQNTNTQGQQLPQTASPLPLLGLLGLGSLASGLIVRRKK
jgi:LPXTG-motif cell wall-anchored protein